METPTKSLADLLAESGDDDNDFICSHCGHSQKERFQTCPSCGKRAKNPTLAEWGKQLPIGIENGDKLIKSFDLVALDWKLEREINQHWAARRNALTISEYIGAILAVAITQVGNHDFTKFKFDKRLVILNRMYQGDIFYMYAYLRLLSVGYQMSLGNVRCSNCGSEFPFTGDLRTLEIAVIDTPLDLLSKIELRNGFELAGETRTKLMVKPPMWSMMGSSMPRNGNEAEMFSAMLSNCVVSVEGMPDGTVITEREISQFSKLDIEVCQEVLDATLAGPRWEIEGNCEKCQSPFFHLVDWTYDSFFALSSRSSRLKKRSRRL